MATPLAKLASHHVQTIVPEEVHKALRDEAYEKKVAMKDLIREILVQHTGCKQD